MSLTNVTNLTVHHGGVGTTAVTIRAGIPFVVVPFLGTKTIRLGVSPKK